MENINKIKNKENINIKEFNNIYNNLKIILNKFDSICNIEDSYYDNDLKNYSNYLKKNVNTFKKNFNIFSEKYNNIPKVDTDKIFMKDFSLPVLKDTKYDFNLNIIEDNPIILSRPLIIKKNNQLFCNYKKIYLNPRPINLELFNELCYFTIYSLVNESLNVEIKKKYKKEDENKKEEKIIELYDTEEIEYMKLNKSNIDPNSSIIINFAFPPPNTSNEEKIYRLIRNLNVSDNKSSINIIIEIIFVIYPIQINFYSEKYSLTFDNQQYKLNTTKLLKGEIIKFKIENNF